MNKKNKLVEGEQSINAVQAGIQSIQKKLWPNGMSDERITDYIVYHLYRKRESWYSFFASDLFTDYAISKYYEQFLGLNKRPGMNYYIDQWLEDGGLSRQKITDMIAAPKPNKLTKLVYMPSEELIKKRFYNTNNGYMLCQNNTTGWAPKSESCQQCKFQNDCIVDTERKYPELIRLRRKDYEKTK